MRSRYAQSLEPILAEISPFRANAGGRISQSKRWAEPSWRLRATDWKCPANFVRWMARDSTLSNRNAADLKRQRIWSYCKARREPRYPLPAASPISKFFGIDKCVVRFVVSCDALFTGNGCFDGECTLESQTLTEQETYLPGRC
jgi:hypothetical protein